MGEIDKRWAEFEPGAYWSLLLFGVDVASDQAVVVRGVYISDWFACFCVYNPARINDRMNSMPT